MNGLSKSGVVCQPQSARRAAPPVYRPVPGNPVSQPKSVHARTAQPQSLPAHTGAAASRVVATVPRRPIMPSRSIQQYRVLAGNKILGVMPAKKPWGGYPYAVVNGALLPAQTPGAHAAPDDFLTNVGGNAANVVNHPGGYSLRVSDDSNLAIEDSNLNLRQPKSFYATQQVVTDANLELGRVGSAFRLQGGAHHLTILTGWWGTKNLLAVTPVYNGGNADNAPQNCNEMAGRVLGTGTARFTNDAGTAASVASQRIGGISEQRWQTLYRDRNITAQQLEDHQASRYVNHRDDAEVRRRQANEHAKPEVGDAFMIATIGHGVPQPNGLSRVLDVASGLHRDLGWSYHFAGVVARSGNDRITLENYARGDNRVANADPRWYFQMYGEAQGQSFHEFYSARPDYANPVTISIANPNRPAPDPWWQPVVDAVVGASG